MSLRSILGGSRVKKRQSSSSTKRSSSSSTPSWIASLARTKPSAAENKTKSTSENDAYQDRLEDLGPSHLPYPPSAAPSINANPNSNLNTKTTISTLSTTITTTTTTTILNLHTLILQSMFTPLPPTGLSSTHTAALLNFRLLSSLPPLVSASHLRAALLASGTSAVARSPAAAERAIAEAVRAGRVRRVVVPTLVLSSTRAGGGSGRGGGGAGAGLGGVVGGEVLIDVGVLEGMVRGCKVLGGEEVREGWVKWLRAHPGAVRVDAAGLGKGEWEGLGWREVDALVREGFLTAVNDGGGGAGGGLGARPEQRYARISLETVARTAAGSYAAVGGEGVLHAAGGTGARSLAGPARYSGPGALSSGELSVAVPGTGVFVKLVSAALDHLAELLRKTQYKEMPESDLREKWDGHVVGASGVGLAKKARGEFTGVMPGRTKKWKEFQGLSFEWVLREALGAGVVEVFETRSVGRGVRLV